jgi:hypothetical protein
MIEENNPNKLIEGEDFYYTPEGYKCYRKHHLKRYCRSGCRHCLMELPTPMGKKGKL